MAHIIQVLAVAVVLVAAMSSVMASPLGYDEGLDGVGVGGLRRVRRQAPYGNNYCGNYHSYCGSMHLWAQQTSGGGCTCVGSKPNYNNLATRGWNTFNPGSSSFFGPYIF